MTDQEGQPSLEPGHWAHYQTDALRELLTSLEAMRTQPRLTIAAVKAELERRRLRRGCPAAREELEYSACRKRPASHSSVKTSRVA